MEPGEIESDLGATPSGSGGEAVGWCVDRWVVHAEVEGER